ncbi:hypothetical protein OAF34_00930 [Pirellulaceae bacterium]|nr:hypothetical protein [Pirellulaceae bacterium]
MKSIAPCQRLALSRIEFAKSDSIKKNINQGGQIIALGGKRLIFIKSAIDPILLDNS